MQSKRVILLEVEFAHYPMALATHPRAFEADHLQAVTAHRTFRAVIVLHLSFQCLHLLRLAEVFHQACLAFIWLLAVVRFRVFLDNARFAIFVLVVFARLVKILFHMIDEVLLDLLQAAVAHNTAPI